jgi:hypothetical protein
MVKSEIEPMAVEADAEIRQIKTMADHSVNVTFNLPEYCLPQVQQMMEWMAGAVKIVVVQA